MQPGPLCLGRHQEARRQRRGGRRTPRERLALGALGGRASSGPARVVEPRVCDANPARRSFGGLGFHDAARLGGGRPSAPSPATAEAPPAVESHAAAGAAEPGGCLAANKHLFSAGPCPRVGPNVAASSPPVRYQEPYRGRKIARQALSIPAMRQRLRTLSRAVANPQPNAAAEHFVPS